MNNIRNETHHAINGVPGRFLTLRRPPAPWKAGTFANQKWVSESRPIAGYGAGGRITVKIRFDDDCKNGHNTFAITGDIRSNRGEEAGGCLHDEIAQVFPELAHLIRWHLSSTDGPLHYVANALYHASDRDHWGYAKGEPCAWDEVVYFGNSPVSHKIKSDFSKWLQSRIGTPGEFRVIALAHRDNGKPGAHQYSPNYTFVGFGEQWHDCPFSDEATAQQWAQGLNTGIGVRFERIPTEYSEGKARNLDAARSCAAWPDATDEQLCLPKDQLRALLEARLPALMAEMRADIEGAGFMWQCPSE